MRRPYINKILYLTIMRYLPNAISLARILLVPVFLVLLFWGTFQSQLAALVVFSVAAISDWLDGRVARHYNVKSRSGRFLDPLADKVLVLGTFIALPFLLPGVVPWWAVAVIAVRDLAITGLRLWAEKRNEPLRTVRMAKTKTAIQLVFLVTTLVLLVASKLPGVEPIRQVASWLLYGPALFIFLLVVVILTAYTGIAYFFNREIASD